MKKLLLLSALLFAGFSAKAIEENDSLGLPGDNLDLFGVLELFKQSSSLEDFEKKINDPANEVNDLDLNNDENVDYIRVIDQREGDAHAIILQVPVSATESQDVAAIEIEKTGADAADLQIVGDEELYGADYIVEVKEETKSGAEARWQGFSPVAVVNVWLWPSVRFIYAPAYVVWVSPYRWAYYPVYWKPWRPVGWRIHRARVVRYHMHYGYAHHHRMARAHVCYHNHRVASHSVHQRYEGHHQRHAARQGKPNGNVQKNGGAQKNNGVQKKGTTPKNGNAQKGKSQPQHKQGGGQKKASAAPRGGGKRK
ncbi:MAG: hypothetical protein M3R17_04675 [Bacteroidota bacterium]|nr:hypothetical protein [Bacteroidota bacterium]